MLVMDLELVGPELQKGANMAYATHVLRVDSVDLVYDPNDMPQQFARMKATEVSDEPPTKEGETPRQYFPECSVHLLIDPARALKVGELLEAKFAVCIPPNADPKPPEED